MKQLTLVDNAWLSVITSTNLEPASETDANIAQNLFEQHKLPSGELLSVDIVLPEQAGIIKYMVNNDLKIIRFGKLTKLKLR